MQKQLAELIQQTEDISKQVKVTFGSLTLEQMNWKPAPNKWSVGECLLHIITTNKAYFPVFKSISGGTYERNIWEKMKLFSKFWGNFLLKAVNPENSKQYKAPSKSKPATSVVHASIIEEFISNQKELAEGLAGLDNTDHEQIISSPFASPVTFFLRDIIRIVIFHQQRHFNQAKRVTKMEGFPK